MRAPPVPETQKNSAPSAARRAADSRAHLRQPLQALQRSIGNQAVLRLQGQSSGRIQRKLVLSSINDPLEQEADRVAERVVAMTDAAVPLAAGDATLQRKSVSEDENELLRKASSGEQRDVIVPPSVYTTLARSGRPLDAGTRAFFESRLGMDLGNVRLHDDAQASASARAIGAHAYTVGNHIAFAAGANAASDGGRRLLAHELVHVVQQSGNSGAGVSPGPVHLARFPEAEAEVETQAGDSAIAAGERPSATLAGGPAPGFFQVTELVKLITNGAIQVFVDLIENTRAVIAKVKGSIQELINNTPGEIQEVYDTHIAPLLNKTRGPGGQEPEHGSASAGGVAQAFIQRQRQDPEQEEQGRETHAEGVWRHLKVRGSYFVDHWWDVVEDALLEILVPGVALYRHAPAMWKKVNEAWDAFSAGKPSQGWDAVLDAARELWAMAGAFIAQVSIAAFVIGSILGTPIVGVAALTTIGLSVIGIDVALQAATIAKAISNFDDVDEDDKRLEQDYGRVADSSIAIVIMLVLVALGAVAKVTAATLLRRFPALGRIAEGLKAKVKDRLGIKPQRPPKMTSKLKPLEPVPPPALHPERARMPPDVQLAFDKWMSERPRGFDPARALAGKDDAALRRMFQTQLDWLAEQRAREAFNAQWEGEMLDPRMKNTGGPSRDVETRWNDAPPAEIDQGVRLNAKTGEKIALFGDDFPGIDGTIGKPPRPLQLKHVPATEDISNIPRVAGEALKKARAHGFSRVEVSIEAPGRTVAQVKAAFKANPSAFTDSVGVSRVRVWCADGVFEPTSFSASPPPIHPNLDSDTAKDKVPAGGASGG